MQKKIVAKLASYVDALRPIIYINHFDFVMIDEIIKELAGSQTKCLEFNNALGLINFENKHPMLECTLEQFLTLTGEDGFTHETFLVLKDVHHELNEPKIIALLKRISEFNLYKESYYCTVFIVSEVLTIPKELENYITIFDFPLPDNEEILKTINNFSTRIKTDIKQDVVNELAVSFKGLNEFQINQILAMAYQEGGNIDGEDKQLILDEKEQFIKKSGMLEVINFRETEDDIGGLEVLKNWLRKKAKIFSNLDKAMKQGVDVPKGIMLVGMPGCGKSLSAKATASLFKIPLLRLDIGRLLGKYVGESENNMRNALRLAEAISPCVLWIDEIEKAFSGVNGKGEGNEVTTRLFGQFLTWMQEKENTVFVVATANNTDNISPEFLRKGRFDELFFVDLPNEDERLRILYVHLKKRKKWNQEIDVFRLIECTQGFSGADLEAVVKEAIETAYIEGKEKLETIDLLNAIDGTFSIEKTLGTTKIDNIRAEYKVKRKFKDASINEQDLKPNNIKNMDDIYSRLS